MPLEDKVAAIFDLIDRIVTLQIDGRAVLFRELRAQQPGPVVRALFYRGRSQLIGDAACNAFGSEIDRNALSSLRNATPWRRNSISMKLWPLR